MVSEALRQVMLAAAGAGRLTGVDLVVAAAEHPVCGDLLEFDCRLDDGVVLECAWRAEGCPATMAVAAALPQALVGHPIGEAGARLRRLIADLGGLAATESHALAMALRALAGVAKR